MKNRAILRILVKPKPSRILLAATCGLMVGLVATIMLGLFILDPITRSIAGGLIAVFISTWQFRQITEKNRGRAEALENVLQEKEAIQVTRVTTNPIKPGKAFRVAAGRSSVTIPEKRWVKIAPILGLPAK